MKMGKEDWGLEGEIWDQMVQPQNKKKKHSIETRAMDSNAVTTLHTTSSTIDTLIVPDHLSNLIGDQWGVMYDANVPGQDDTVESSHIGQRNVEPISFLTKRVFRVGIYGFQILLFILITVNSNI